MKNRIEQKMEQLESRQEKAFITYMTAGLPDFAGCKELIRTQEKAGTDILELGIPFSDPVADGPVIQNASCKAIQQGVSLKKVFEMMQEIRAEGVEIPIIFMLYYNTIFHCGLEQFVSECVRCGRCDCTGFAPGGTGGTETCAGTGTCPHTDTACIASVSVPCSPYSGECQGICILCVRHGRNRPERSISPGNHPLPFRSKGSFRNSRDDGIRDSQCRRRGAHEGYH